MALVLGSCMSAIALSIERAYFFGVKPELPSTYAIYL